MRFPVAGTCPVEWWGYWGSPFPLQDRLYAILEVRDFPFEVDMRVYSIFDRKQREYGSLVLAKNDEVARRACVDAIHGSGSQLEKHPEDFDLYHVGQFDESKGCLEVETPTLVVTLLELLEAAVNAQR